MDGRYDQDGHAHQAYDGEARHPFCQQGKECEVEVVADHDEGREKMPYHRQMCINRGCPYVCCIPRARIFWIILLLLIQVGALVLLLLDLQFNSTYGSSLSRYQSQQGLITSICTIEKYETKQFESCGCDDTEKGYCEGLGHDYECLEIFVKAVDAFSRDIVTNSAQLFRSDWEYALDKTKCFNLDICRIDKERSWTNYKRKINHYVDKFDQLRQGIGLTEFTCYIDYPESYKITPSALMELNTTFSDLFCWFILPILTIGLCWIGIVFACYWFGCPCAKKKKKKYEHHKIHRDGGNTTDVDDSDMSPSASGFGRSGSNDSGGWPKSGPADTGGSSWPMYWR